MNPVDLVNHRLRHPDIDYEFRPSFYWEPIESVLHGRANEAAIVTIELQSMHGDFMGQLIDSVDSVENQPDFGNSCCETIGRAETLRGYCIGRTHVDNTWGS